MLTIVIRHFSSACASLGYDGLWIPTPTDLGFSSAAEMFVLLSGYMVGLTYSRKPEAEKKILQRAVKLYFTNWTIFVVLLLFSFWAPSHYRQVFGLDRHTVDLWNGLLSFGLFKNAPFLLDVLFLYVQLFLVSTLVLWVLRRSSSLFIAISLVIYAASQAALWFDPGVALGSAFFLPSWQLLFFIPMALGYHRAHLSIFDYARTHRVFLILTASILAAGIALRICSHVFGWGGVPGIEKQGLGPIRLVHALSIASAYVAAIVLLPSVWSSWFGRAMAILGRNSLNCFVLSIVATYGLAFLWAQSPWPTMSYLIGCFVIVLIVGSGAVYWERRKLVPGV